MSRRLLAALLLAVGAAGVALPAAAQDQPAEPDAPLALRLLPPAPNPAAGPVRLGVVLETAADVRLSVVDVLGREVAAVLDGPLPAGRHDVRVEAGKLAPGTYLVRLVTEAGVTSTPMTVVR